MAISRRKIRYLRQNYRNHSDAQLAKALGVDKIDVRKAREKAGLERTKAEEQALREHAEASPPPYTGQVERPTDAVRAVGRDHAVAVGAALVALGVYVSTLGPTVTGEDSGELITAAYALGVAHPPGYPLWTLLGKVFTFIPVGTVAWRVGFMSACLGAISVYLVCLVARKLGVRAWAALAAALAFAFSGEFWEQAVIAEVYTLNTALTAASLLCLLVWYETRDKLSLYLLAGCYGLGLANHNTTMLLGPLFVGFVLLVDREPWVRWRVYGACTGVALLVAFALYLYLPLASRHNPPVDWGDPETLGNWWDHIARKQYTLGLTENPRSLGRFFHQLAVVGQMYGQEFTPWLAVLPMLGAAVLWRRDRYRFALVGGLLAWTVLGFVLVTNFKFDKESLWLNNVFFVPAYLAAALLMGLFLDRLAGCRVGRYRAAVPAAVLAIATVALPLHANHAKNDKSDYYFAYDYAMNVLRTLPQGAIYFPTADHATFPILYLQAVEGKRPDVVVANKYGYPEASVYRDMPERERKGFHSVPTDAEETRIEDWVIERSDRPVCFTRKRALRGGHMADAGLLYRVVKDGDTWRSPDYWRHYRWHTLDTIDTRGDYTAELILADYWFARGRCYLAEGKTDEGLKALNTSLAVVGENRESLNNLGSVCAEAGQIDEALTYYARALELDPTYALSLKNLAKVYMQKEQFEYALGLFDRLLELASLDYEGLFHGAQCLTQLGRIDEALQRYRLLTQVAPEDPAVFRELGYLLQAQGDEDGARRHFARSLALDRNQPELALLAAHGPDQGKNAAGTPNPQYPSIPGLDGINPVPPLPKLPGLGSDSPVPLPGQGRPQPSRPSLPQFPTLPGGGSAR